MDYNETLLNAVDTLIGKRLESVNYDTTNTYTVVGNDEADEGKYLVSDGLRSFYAYSRDTNYKIDDVVYVTIPNNDPDKQKTIIGKKVTDDSTPFVYISPFSQLIDVSSNLITGSPTASLLANETILASETQPWTNDNAEMVHIWGSENNYINKPLIGYTRLGLQAQFRSWLSAFECIEGDYGLIVKIKSRINDTITSGSSYKEEDYILQFSCKDMYGNIYGFDSYYQQEKVFDISEIKGQIIGIEAWFYQDPGTFKDVNEELLPCSDFLKNPLSNNLFAKDVYLCLGFDAAEFSDEQIQLYTFNSLTYTSKDSNDIHTDDVEKKIYLRWIHMVDNKTATAISGVSQLITDEYSIKWYRYKAGSPSADYYSGTDWEYVDSAQISEDGFLYTFTPDVSLQQEKIKAVLIYNDIPYYSNVMTFTNEQTVANITSVEISRSVTLVCEDKSYGNYRIYDRGNSLLDQSQSRRIRDLTCYFANFGTKEANAEPLSEASWIEWRAPASNTMINLVSTDDNNTTLDYNKIDSLPDYPEDISTLEKIYTGIETHSVEGTDATVDTVGTSNGYWSGFMHDEDTDEIVVIWFGNDSYKIQPKINYKIRAYYSSGYTRNTISCIVHKDNKDYEGSKTFTFGVAGTCGTDYTLEIDFDEGETALTSGAPEGTDEYNQEISLTARIYDYNNNELTETEDFTYQWSWYEDSINLAGIGLKTNDESKSQVFLTNTRNAKMDDLLYLQCKITGCGDYDLVAVKPIPVRRYVANDKYRYISGADIVTYGSDGYPNYRKDEYKIYKKGSKVGTGSWRIFNPNNDVNSESGNYVARISEAGVLQPASVYTEETKQYGVQYYEVEMSSQEVETQIEVLSTEAMEAVTNEYKELEEKILAAVKQQAALEMEAAEKKAALAKAAAAGEVELSYDEEEYVSNYTEVMNEMYSQLEALEAQYNLIQDAEEQTSYLESTLYPVEDTTNTLKDALEAYEDALEEVNSYTVDYDSIIRESQEKLEELKEEYIDIGSTDIEVGSEYFYYALLQAQQEMLLAELEDICSTTADSLDVHVATLDECVEAYNEQVEMVKEALTIISESSESEATIQVATTMTVTDLIPVTIITEYWTQPIFTSQNLYPSGTLNKWNGKDIEMDEDSGTIVARGMAAGKKETDNTFSGVMLGDWSSTDTESSITQHTGVYGFNHGSMSYAFKDDGTAFIGKAGGGRINFDGNESTISSESYNISRDLNGEDNAYGMMIDLDDGYIDIKGAKLGRSKVELTSADGKGYYKRTRNITPTGARVQISTAGTKLKPYFKITAAAGAKVDSNTVSKGNALINISEDEYYLQTDNFVDGGGLLFEPVDAGTVTESNYADYYVEHVYYEEENSDDTEFDTNREYYIINGDSRTKVDLYTYTPYSYYCDFVKDSSLTQRSGVQYYTFDTSSASYVQVAEGSLTQSLYEDNKYYYLKDSEKTLCSDESYSATQTYYSTKDATSPTFMFNNKYVLGTYYLPSTDNYVLAEYKYPVLNSETVQTDENATTFLQTNVLTFYKENFINNIYTEVPVSRWGTLEFSDVDGMGYYIKNTHYEYELDTSSTMGSYTYYTDSTGSTSIKLYNYKSGTYYYQDENGDYQKVTTTPTANDGITYYIQITQNNYREVTFYFPNMYYKRVTKYYSLATGAFSLTQTYYTYDSSSDSYSTITLDPSDFSIEPENFSDGDYRVNEKEYATTYYIGDDYKWYKQVDGAFEEVDRPTIKEFEASLTASESEKYFVDYYESYQWDYNFRDKYCELDSDKFSYYYTTSDLSIDLVYNIYEQNKFYIVADPEYELATVANGHSTDSYLYQLINGSYVKTEMMYSLYVSNTYYYKAESTEGRGVADTDIKATNTNYYLDAAGKTEVLFWEPNTYYYKVQEYPHATSYDSTVQYYKNIAYAGTKIDLGKNSITSYDARIKLGKTNSAGSLVGCAVLDMTESTYPIYAGNTSSFGPNGAPFKVSWEGYMESTSGKIGGWTIGTDTLSAGKITLNSNGSISGGSSYKWSIDTAGKAKFSYLEASTGGSIGGWEISSKELSSGTTHLYSQNQTSSVSISGSSARNNWRINVNNKFGVDSNGNLFAKDASITGNIAATTLSATTGTIGNWVIKDGNLQSSNGTVTLNGSTGAIKGAAISGSSISGGSISVGGVYVNGDTLKLKDCTITSSTTNGVRALKFSDTIEVSGSIYSDGIISGYSGNFTGNIQARYFVATGDENGYNTANVITKTKASTLTKLSDAYYYTSSNGLTGSYKLQFQLAGTVTNATLTFYNGLLIKVEKGKTGSSLT